MSTPLARASRAATGTSVPTRQQLDELDALLQRMLDLPVNQADEEPEPDTVPADPPPAADLPVQEESPRPRPPEPPRRKDTGATASPVPKIVPPTPAVAPPRATPRRTEPQPEPPADPPRPRAYPASYMVVETNNPFFTQPESPRSPVPRAADAGLGPRMLPLDEPQTPEDEQPHEDPAAEAEQDSTEEGQSPASALDDMPAEWVPFQSSWQPSEQTWKPLAETWEQARTVPSPAPEPPPAVVPPPRSAPSPKKPAPRPPAPPRPLPRNPPPAPPPAGPVVVTQTAEPLAGPHVPEVFVRPRSPVLPEVQATRAAKPPVPTPTEQPQVGAGSAPPSQFVLLLPFVWFNVVFDVGLILLGPLGTWLKGRSGRALLGTVGLLCLAAAIALAVADEFGWTW